MKFVVEANDAERFEVVAFDDTRFVVVPVVTERFEIDDELLMTIPMVEVGVSAPFVISHDLPKSCDTSAYAERSEKVGRPSDEVATAVGTPDAPVAFASTEFAAIAERESVAFDPPTSAPAPPVMVIPLFAESVVVATDTSPAVPLP